MAVGAAAAAPGPTQRHTFAAEDDDHCETPAEAYDDITAALNWVAQKRGVTSRELRIYDPYYCAGAVVRNLTRRGFPRVHNKNEDFYAAIDSGSTPEYDVLVTNPPYSKDHIERILRFCVSSGKPWFLLVPNFVYVNPYYTKAMDEAKANPFYLVPTTRYWYTAPTGARENKAPRTSPFLSFWYCDLAQPDVNAAFVSGWRAKQGLLAAGGPTRPTLCGHLNQLPHSMRAQYDPTRRRLRKKQREAHDRKKRKREAEREAEVAASKASQPCRFGSACTRPACWFMHPGD